MRAVLGAVALIAATSFVSGATGQTKPAGQKTERVVSVDDCIKAYEDHKDRPQSEVYKFYARHCAGIGSWPSGS